MVVRYLPNATASYELYHHGVEGQSWGKRHGPPYPLDPNPSKQAARKRNSKGFIQKVKEKRQQKKAEKEASKQLSKEDVLKSGSAKVIEKEAKNLTNEELRYALTRAQLMKSVKNLKKDNNVLRKGREALHSVAMLSFDLNTISRTMQNIDNMNSPLNARRKLTAEERSIGDLSKAQFDTKKYNILNAKLDAAVKSNNKEEIDRLIGGKKKGK